MFKKTMKTIWVNDVERKPEVKNRYMECLLITSVPVKALRMHVESLGLPSDSTCVLKAEPGKLEIKTREPGILFISLQFGSLFKLAIMT